MSQRCALTQKEANVDLVLEGTEPVKWLIEGQPQGWHFTLCLREGDVLMTPIPKPFHSTILSTLRGRPCKFVQQVHRSSLAHQAAPLLSIRLANP